MKNRLKTLFKTRWPLFIILLVWLIFTSPYFFQEKIPLDTTYLTTWFSPWQDYYSGNAKNGIPDIFTQIIPWKKITIDFLKNGQIPLWNPNNFAGNPHLANFQTAVFSPFNLLFFIFNFVDAWSLLILLQPLLSGIFMYLFCRKINISRGGSCISGLSFMFAGFMTTWMAYGTIGYALLFLPLALYGMEEIINGRKIKGILILSGSLALSVFSGHFQTTIYVYLATVIYGLTSALINKKLFSLTILWIFLALIISVLLSSIQWIPTWQFYQQASRSEAFGGSGMLPFWRLITLLSPDFFGNPVTRNDWLGSYAETCGYAGVTALILAIMAIFKIKKEILPVLAISALSLILILPTGVPRLLIAYHVPVLGVSTFSRAIILLTFSFCVLSGKGFDVIDKQKNWLLKINGVFILSIIVIWIYLTKFSLLLPEQILTAQRNLVLPFVILLTLLLNTVFIKNRKIGVVILLIIVSVDMLRFANKWQPWGEKERFYTTVPVIKFLQEGTQNGERVFGQFGQEVSSYFKIPHLPGYDPLNIERYAELTSALQDGNIAGAGYTSVALVPAGGEMTYPFLNLTGVKYLVYKNNDYDQKISWFFNYWKYPTQDFPVVFRDDKYTVIENKKALPRVFFAARCFIETNDHDIINKIFFQEKTVVFEKKPKEDYKCDNNGEAEIISYGENKVIIKTNDTTGGVLFLSDNFYPGWRAYIDGRETEIFRANYTFRAIIVPEGNHKIVFEYKLI